MKNNGFPGFFKVSWENLEESHPPPKLCASLRGAMARTLRKSMKMGRSVPRGGASFGARLAAAEMYVHGTGSCIRRCVQRVRICARVPLR